MEKDSQYLKDDIANFYNNIKDVASKHAVNLKLKKFTLYKDTERTCDMYLNVRLPTDAPDDQFLTLHRSKTRACEQPNGKQVIINFPNKMEIPEMFNPDDYQIADIYSAPGTKIIFLGENGYEHELEDAKSKLTVGVVYTLKYSDVDSCTTDFYLEEIDGCFNSVMFGKIK